MTWRKQLALLFGAASPFGLNAEKATAAPDGVTLDEGRPVAQRDIWVYSDPSDRERLRILAGHRSHSSHSSHSSHYSGSSGGHSSHSSHYSGSGSYVSPAPALLLPTPKPAPRPAVRAPVKRIAPAPAARAVGQTPQTFTAAPEPLVSSTSETPGSNPAASRPTRDETSAFIQRMQIALIVRGYDPGPADGVLSATTRAALQMFQRDKGLSVTGYMDVATLRQLGITN